MIASCVNKVSSFLFFYLFGLIALLLCSCSNIDNEEGASGSIDFQNVFIFPEHENERMCGFVADQVIEQVKREPNSVIVLPTGSTPLGVYKRIVEKFKQDEIINFSNVKFFNLDEYIDISPDHPLSYHYYMKVYFYDPLHSVDPKRAPRTENIFIPSKDKGANWYLSEYNKAIKERPLQKADLVILGVGGAYPVKVKKDGEVINILKGGHIAFNEPGSKINSRTRVVNLSKKTMIDTGFRFKSFGFMQRNNDIDFGVGAEKFSDKVPSRAITMGVADILNSRRIIVMASGEEKSPVIREVFRGKINSNFPVSYLLDHKNVTYVVDDKAASMIDYEAWRRSNKIDTKYKNRIWKGMVSGFARHGSVREVLYDRDAAVNVLRDNDARSRLLGEFRGYLVNAIRDSNLPRERRVLILSPHPDDDVISMGACIKKLLDMGNKVFIAYAVSGENAVSENDPKYRDIYDSIKISAIDSEARKRAAKEKVRELEAISATSIIGISSNNLRFMKFDYYYRRGIPGVNPITDRDKRRMKELIKETRPDYIFFAAENDPHGAHGLSTKLLAISVDELGLGRDIVFMGYRGAYISWPIYEPESLVMVPFNRDLMQLKVISIKQHRSQLDPMFPSFDPRPFYERVRSRNHGQAKLVSTILRDNNIGEFAELFRKFSHNEFIATYR